VPSQTCILSVFFSGAKLGVPTLERDDSLQKEKLFSTLWGQSLSLAARGSYPSPTNTSRIDDLCHAFAFMRQERPGKRSTFVARSRRLPRKLANSAHHARTQPDHHRKTLAKTRGNPHRTVIRKAANSTAKQAVAWYARE